MKTLVHIGTDKKTVKLVAKAIMSILKCKTADQETKIRALDSFTKSVSVHDISFTGCTFLSKPD